MLYIRKPIVLRYITTLVIFTICTVFSVKAQRNYYFELGVGYALGLNTQRDFNNETVTTGMVVTQKQEIVKYGLGRGRCLQLVFGGFQPVIITIKNSTDYVTGGWGYELELSHLAGDKTKIETTSNNNGQMSNSYQEHGFSSFFLAPKFVFFAARKLTMDKKVTFSIGPNIALRSRGSTDIYSKNTSSVIQEKQMEIKYNMNIGFTSAIKFWKYGRGSYFYFEIFHRQNSLYAKSSTVNSYKIAGNEQVDNMAVSQRETEYNNSRDYNSTTPTNSALPTQSLTYVSPISSLGLKVGLGILLNAGDAAEKERRQELKNKYKEEKRNISGSVSEPNEPSSSVELGIDKTKFKSELNFILTALKNKELSQLVDYKKPTDYTNSWYSSIVTLNGFADLKGQYMMGILYFTGDFVNSSAEPNKSKLIALKEIIDASITGYTREKDKSGERYTYTNKLDKDLYFSISYYGTSSIEINFSQY